VRGISLKPLVTIRSRALDNPATSRSSERTNFFYFRSKQQGVEVAMTVIISNNDGLARLRDEARRRRTLRKGPARPYRPDLRPTYEAPIAATRTIVGGWFTDELGNRARIIEGA
jgi:hypothetical protein